MFTELGLLALWRSRLAEDPLYAFFDEGVRVRVLEKLNVRKSPRMDGRQLHIMPTDGSICVQSVAW